MKTYLVLSVAAVSVVTGFVQRCRVCKTENAADIFSNLHCDELPETAPDCTLTGHSRGRGFQQNCPANSNCLTITKEDQEVRMCTKKTRLETIETTDGIVMEVCGSNMCNAASRRTQQASLALLVALTGFLARLV